MKRLLILLVILIGLFALGSGSRWLPNFDSGINKIAKKEIISQKVVEEESVVIDAIDKALPSVVTVAVSTTQRAPDRLQIDPFDPFGYWRRIPGESTEIEKNIGSGFIISSDGLIVTNKHVVSESDSTYKVVTSDGKEYDVEQISRDPLNDLAILKVSATNLKPLELGDSSKLKLGQLVVAIGTPLGEFSNTVTSGIVSGLQRDITAGSPFENSVEELNNIIQTDAAISPGNSGGPLINSSGQAIGVNTAISQQGQNIGFAIPINVVNDLLQNFDKSSNTITRPFLGVRYRLVDDTNEGDDELPKGAYVVDVVPNSPSQKAGIKAGDIITQIDGKPVGDSEGSLRDIVAAKKIGDKLEVKLVRDGQNLSKTVSLEPVE